MHIRCKLRIPQLVFEGVVSEIDKVITHLIRTITS